MRVLIVDDEAGTRSVMRAMLEEAGLEVVEAADGMEAFRLLRRLGADVVLCDLFMPEMDGLEVIRELRRGFPDVKVVATSGGGCTGAVDLLPVARYLGAASVLPKPFDRRAALSAILEACPVPPTG